MTVNAVNDAPVLAFTSQVVDTTAIELSAVEAGTAGFVINGVSASDFAGFSVRGAGDVNGDGLDDLIVGAYGDDPNGSYSGASFVVFGKANGTAVELSTVQAGTGGFVINGVAAGDRSGRSVSDAGDVNGDGLDDLIIGAHLDDPNGSNSGASFVVFGKANGTAVELSAVEAGTGGFVINGVSSGDLSGYAVSGAGDVNGDGLDDLIVGAEGDDPNGSDSGASFVVFGKADGTAVELSAVEAGTGGFVINGVSSNDFSGRSVSSAGDVNGDGLDDLIVGADGDDPNGSASGASFVVFGKADGTAVELSNVEAGTGGFVINGVSSNDYSGFSVSGAGDVNGDGLDDLIIGAVRDDPNGSSSGASFVVFGKADGTAVELSNVEAGTGGFVINGVSGGARSGNAVSGAGDVNGDGLDDLIVGAYYDSPNGSNSGASFVVFGKADGTAVELSNVEAGTGGFVINGVAASDVSGKAVSGAGDVNGDGRDDLIVGAFGDDPNGSNSGTAFVVFTPTVASTGTDFSQVAAFSVDEDTALAINGLTLSDVDLSGGNVEVTLVAANGIIDVTDGAATISGDLTGSVTVSGALADVTAAIGAITYTGNANFSGADTITVTVSDLGNTGSGGAQTDSEVLNITVNAVNDAPVINLPQASFDGATVGTELLVNEGTTGEQSRPHGAALSNGNFVVTYLSQASPGDSFGLAAIILDGDGNTVVSEFLVNTETDGLQFDGDVAPLSDGGFFITYASQDPAHLNGATGAVVGQRFDANGVKVAADGSALGNPALGDEIVIANPSNNGNHKAVELSDGRLAVTFADGNNAQVQVIGLGNGADIAAIRVDETAGGRFHNDIVALNNGGFAAVYGGGSQELFLRTFDSSGNPGAIVQINQFTDGTQSDAVVASLSDGGFVVAWRSQSASVRGSGISGVSYQRFDANGDAVQADGVTPGLQEIVVDVNPTVNNEQVRPEISATADGGFVISYFENLPPPSDVQLVAFDSRRQPDRLDHPGSRDEFQHLHSGLGPHRARRRVRGGHLSGQ